MFWQCKKGKSKNLTVPFMVGILLVHLVLPGVCAGKTSSKAAGVIDAANTPTLHNILQKSEQSSNYKNYLAQYPQAERIERSRPGGGSSGDPLFRFGKSGMDGHHGARGAVCACFRILYRRKRQAGYEYLFKDKRQRSV